MTEEMIFAQTLEALCATAKEQGNVVSESQVKEAFSEAGIALEEAQLELVYSYLKTKKIGIGEPMDPFDYLTAEETDYLESYLKELETLEEASEGVREAVTLSAMAGDPDAKQRLIEIFLPQVVEISKLYAGQGAFLEDLIGEGNVALAMAVEMIDSVGQVEQAQGMIASMIMEAMENYIAGNTDEKKTAEAMAHKANDVLDKAKEMAEELGRKVTVQELSEETGMPAEQIREAIRITADHIEYLDTSHA